MILQHPILFSTPMVQAILSDQKTMTRRVVKFKNYSLTDWEDWYGTGPWPTIITDEGHEPMPCPFGKIGDILWVRETVTKKDSAGKYHYKADVTDSTMWVGHIWKPSIHMPKEACRIFLEVTTIRAERLQDISYEDANAEGVYREWDGFAYWYQNYLDAGEMLRSNPQHSFKSLWNSINAEKHPWDTNPWVWVIEFKRIDAPQQ